MNPSKLVLLAIIAFVTGSVSSPAREVTLTIGPGKGADEVIVNTNEVAQIVTWGPIETTGHQIEIIKDGIQFVLSSGIGSRYLAISGGLGLPRIVGPATIKLVATGSARALGTVQITPETFPPDKTVIIPQDTGANVVLESSTNLIQWSSAMPGLYTNRTSNLFFRIRAERILLPANP